MHSLYQLKPELLEKWVALNNFLTNVFHVLSIMTPMNIVLTLVPRTTNYKKPQQTEKAAHCAMSHVLHCFQHLMYFPHVMGYQRISRRD